MRYVVDTIVSKEISMVAKDRGLFMYRGPRKLDNLGGSAALTCLAARSAVV